MSLCTQCIKPSLLILKKKGEGKTDWTSYPIPALTQSDPLPDVSSTDETAD